MLGDYLKRTWQLVTRDPLYAPRVAWALLKEPVEGRERIAERLGEWRSHSRPRPSYEATPDWEEALHRERGWPWPCPARGEFGALWNDVAQALRRQGIALGRGSFAGWDDADPALARLVFCAALHGRPEVVVETGVARGLTTRFILEALSRNARGRLWSIDVPPLIASRYQAEVGVAVPAVLRHRWTLIKGSSRRHLALLLRRLGSVDLFVHDSMHTDRNVAFELEHAWAWLAPGGLAVADDVERSSAFAAFRATTRALTLVGLADDHVANIGIAVKGA